MLGFDNLAGNNQPEKRRNEIVKTELLLAGLEPIANTDMDREVKTVFKAELNGWIFFRAWVYWVAINNKSGLPLEIANKMHFSEYPSGSIYGKTIRVGGDCGCKEPVKGLRVPESIQAGIFAKYPKPADWCKADIDNLNAEFNDYSGEKFVDVYHIDSIMGLKKFVETIKSMTKSDLITVNKLELASNLAHSKTFDIFQDADGEDRIQDEDEMYDGENYKDNIQDVFNSEYDFFLTEIEKVGV